jgi:hypothetical protein
MSTVAQVIRQRFEKLQARIESSEPDENEPAESRVARERNEVIERVSVKLQAAVWVLVASLLLYYSDIVNVVYDDSKTQRYRFLDSIFFRKNTRTHNTHLIFSRKRLG